MYRALLWLAAVVLVGGGVWYVGQSGVWSPEDDTREQPATLPEAGDTEPDESPTPEIRHPIPEPAPPPEPTSKSKSTADAAPDAARPEGPTHPLPDLDESDAPLLDTLDGLVERETVRELFHIDRIVRRVVLTIDNLARNKLSLEKRIAQPVSGRFRVRMEGDVPYLDPANYARYTPYVRLAESTDIDDLVAIYVRYYPLFQRAYEELGYPDRYFNDRLVEVIDHLLATPKVERPIKLKRPHVLHEYADPQLEDLSPGRKVLIRMGPENAARVKSRLQALRKALTSQGELPSG